MEMVYEYIELGLVLLGFLINLYINKIKLFKEIVYLFLSNI